MFPHPVPQSDFLKDRDAFRFLPSLQGKKGCRLFWMEKSKIFSIQRPMSGLLVNHLRTAERMINNAKKTPWSIYRLRLLVCYQPEDLLSSPKSLFSIDCANPVTWDTQGKDGVRKVKAVNTHFVTPRSYTFLRTVISACWDVVWFRWNLVGEIDIFPRGKDGVLFVCLPGSTSFPHQFPVLCLDHPLYL